jgi:DNA ligase (NAD+)
VRELKLGIGDRIKVYKANMIIPQIAENLTGSGNVRIPDSCPVCGGRTEIRALNEAQSLYCVNEECPAKQIKSFSQFVSREALNVDGLSEATLEKLIDCGFIKSFPDLFELEKHKENIVRLEGFGEKSYDNLISSIEKTSHTTLPRLIFGLGINGIGAANAKLICKAFDYDIGKIKSAKASELAEIDGIGDVMAKSLEDFFQNERNLAVLERLLAKLDIEKPEMNASGQNLAGLVFVVTGSLNSFENRNALKEVIESRGGKVTGSVTNKTTCLINNDNTSNSTKNKTAKELGIPILTEEEFITRYLN